MKYRLEQVDERQIFAVPCGSGYCLPLNVPAAPIVHIDCELDRRWNRPGDKVPEKKIPDCANRGEKVTLTVGNTTPWAGALAPAFINLLPESRGNGTGCLKVLLP